MRFMPQRDYQTMIQINRELINTVIDTVVIIYKLNTQTTQTNIYNESMKKSHYVGVRVPCLINQQNTSPTLDGALLSVSQGAQFYFLRNELELKNVYVEVGDIIEFHDSYFEVVNVNETQLIAGQVHYNHSIIAECTLTRIPATGLEKPIL